MKKNYSKYCFIAVAFISTVLHGCDASTHKHVAEGKDTMSCSSHIPARFAGATTVDTSFAQANVSEDGMVYIRGAEFSMGAADDEGRQDEYPSHKVRVDDFLMDQTEVTN